MTESKPEKILNGIARIGGPSDLEMLDRAVVDFNHVWTVICDAEVRKKVRASRSDILSRYEVMAAVLPYLSHYSLDPQALAWFRAKSEEDQEKLANYVFPHSAYGL